MRERENGGRNLTSRELKLLYVKRTMRGYRNHKISPKPKVQVFSGKQEKAVSREITLFEVEFSPTRVNFSLRACVCVSKGGVAQFFPLTL